MRLEVIGKPRRFLISQAGMMEIEAVRTANLLSEGEALGGVAGLLTLLYSVGLARSLDIASLLLPVCLRICAMLRPASLKAKIISCSVSSNFLPLGMVAVVSS